MPINTVGYAVKDKSANLEIWKFELRDLGAHDVHIRVVACGICHSDLHKARNDWGDKGIYPMVPGHEITGTVATVGSRVTKFVPGDKAAVGVFADSCRACARCKHGLESYCQNVVSSYSGRMLNDNSPTYGGYARDVVCKDTFVLKWPDSLDLVTGAPLVCAGITVYSPMKKFGMDLPGKRIGVIGLGGLGHMAVKFGVSFGNQVTVIDLAESKRKVAIEELKADQFINASHKEAMEAAASSLDFILDTTNSGKDLDPVMALLDFDGTLICLGLPPIGQQHKLSPASIIDFRKRIVGSHVGGITETEEMLEYCAMKGITATIEMIPPDYINTAWDRMIKSDVLFRFVVDIQNFWPSDLRIE